MGERLIGPVHCLLRCQAQPVGLAEFSKTALFLAGRESKVRRRTLYWDRIWWVLRPSPAHRKTKSSHPSSNLKFIETSGKQTWENYSPNILSSFPLCWGKFILPQQAVNVAGRRETPANWGEDWPRMYTETQVLFLLLFNLLCNRGHA